MESYQKATIQKYLLLKPIGKGRTNTVLVTFHWDHPLAQKTVALHLTEEALQQPRWRHNFKELEDRVDFLILFGSILHSPQQAQDIDLIGVISEKKNFVRIQQIIDKIQKTQSKRIHSIILLKKEFAQELVHRNRAFLDAIKRGIILFGPENFVECIREVEGK